MPEPLFSFYKIHEKRLIKDAVNPDNRRYVDSLEGSRHFLDVENYPDSIPQMPIYRSQAIQKYGAAFLNQHGQLPWQIQISYLNLIKAFYEKNIKAILRHSTDLGHYLADGHVPLHTTENYNGQLTNQKGIHALWESRLPELFADQYNLFVGKARFIPNINLHT